MNRSTRLPRERVMRSHGRRIVLMAGALACIVTIAHAAQATRPAAPEATAATQAAMAKGRAAASAHQVARTQVCTVHKELRIGDYVIRHETCQDSAQAVSNTPQATLAARGGHGTAGSPGQRR